MDVDLTMSEAIRAAGRGALPEAERLCRSVLEVFPRHFLASLVLGDVLLRAKRPNEALAAYDAAAKANPGHATPFTRAAVLRFRMALGRPLAPRRVMGSQGRRLQMTALGSNGRFGNQLLQYAFVRIYANEHQLTAELPDWIGRDVFDLDDPFPSAALPRLDEREVDFLSLLDGDARLIAEHDISGFFCGNTLKWGNRRQQFRDLFRPGGKVRPLLDLAWHNLKAAGDSVIAIHLRRADFGYGRFWIAPNEWYIAWLRTIWPNIERPVLYVATDDPAVVGQFAEFSPWDASRLGIAIPGAEFLVDHQILREADWVAISNSSFSFTAAMLNARARSFVRPYPELRALVTFDPWASAVLLDSPAAKS